MRTTLIITLLFLLGLSAAAQGTGRSTPSDDATRLAALGDVEKYTTDINSHPDDPDAYMLRAKAYTVLGRTDEAIADLTRAIGLSKHPYYKAQTMTDRGKVYLKRGEYAKANADFSAVIELERADAYKPGAYLNRARSQKEQGALAEALRDAGEAIRLYSTLKKTGAKKQLGEAYALRASINCAMGDAKSASADSAMAAKHGISVQQCGTK